MTALLQPLAPDQLRPSISDPDYWADIPTPQEYAAEGQRIALRTHLEALQEDALTIAARCDLLMRGLDAR